MAKTDPKRQKPILAKKWIDICTQNVRDASWSWDEKNTVLYALWLQKAGNCDCEQSHKFGRFCDNCGKKLRKSRNATAKEIVVETLEKQ